MSAPDNPQAFPTGDHTHGGHDGMTLRDWLAGQALAGLLANSDTPTELIGLGWQASKDLCAECAYGHADAMLAARKAKP